LSFIQYIAQINPFISQCFLAMIYLSTVQGTNCVKLVSDGCACMIELLTQPFCGKCAHPVVEGRCKSCELGGLYDRADSINAMGVYMRGGGDPLSSLLKEAKKEPVKAEMLGHLLAHGMKSIRALVAIDIVMWVPKHGEEDDPALYNHAKTMAQTAAKLAGKPVEEDNLVKVKDVKQAVEKLEKRKLQQRGNFRVQFPSRIKGKSVLLIDDILTSGGTTDDCIRALKEAGARSVHVLVAGRNLLK
jgi:predicted amidophosphoribosyltransferase